MSKKEADRLEKIAKDYSNNNESNGKEEEEKWLFDLADMRNAEPMESAWKFFLKDVVNTLVASSDSGKSTLIRNFAAAVITGQDNFLGWPLDCPNRSVLIVSSEDSLRSHRKYFEMLLPDFDQDVSALKFILEGHDIANRLDIALAMRKTDMLFIDTWGDAVQGLYDGDATRKLIGEIKAICRRHNTTVVFVHHTNKVSENIPDKSSVKGAGDFEQMARTVLMMVVYKGSRWLCLVKGNDFEDEDKQICYRLDFEPVRREIYMSSETMNRGEMINRLHDEAAQGRRVEIDWLSIFDGNELRRVDILSAITSTTDLKQRGAEERLKKMVEMGDINKLINGKYAFLSQ